MASYHGGKQKQGFKIATAIADKTQGISMVGYCEPFCGMCGVYRHIPQLLGDNICYLAGDINESVIKMWSATQDGWKPPIECNEQEFNNISSNKTSSEIRGFIGHACTFGGQYFGSYKSSRENTKHLQTQSERVQTIANELKNVFFSNGEYTQFSHLKRYIIYCDPPYNSTENRYYDEYGNKHNFDYSKFLEWCNMMSENNLVIISEYNQPDNFELFWSSKIVPNTLRGRSTTGQEKLFIHKKWYDMIN